MSGSTPRAFVARMARQEAWHHSLQASRERWDGTYDTGSHIDGPFGPSELPDWSEASSLAAGAYVCFGDPFVLEAVVCVCTGRKSGLTIDGKE